jgi:hypothetical protein
MATVHRTDTLHRDVVSAGQAREFPATLAWTVAGAALIAALLGLTIHGAYPGARSTAAMFRGYDVVTAVLVAPALAVATARARHERQVPRLAAASLLASLVYVYAFYVFGTGFGDLFLLHVAVFSTSLVALVLTLASVDLEVVARLARHARVWPAVVALSLLALSLGGMWLGAGVANILDGSVPPGSALVETTAVIHLSLALDLALQVPLCAAAAVLVRRRTAWGYVLAFVALASGIPVQLAYLVALPVQVAAGVPGAVPFDPLEPVILAVYVGGLVSLVWRARPSDARPEPTRARSSPGGPGPSTLEGLPVPRHHRTREASWTGGAARPPTCREPERRGR